MSKKRTLRRFPYVRYNFDNVALETAGTVDLDIEIKFGLGGQGYSIDVRKNFLPELKDLYKALLKIAEIQHENSVMQSYAQASLDLAANTVGRIAKMEQAASDQFKAINQYAYEWRQEMREKHLGRDFGAVFEKYINN